jgi:hypothetical protein
MWGLIASDFSLHSSSRPLLVAKASLASVCGTVELRRASYAFFELSGDDVCVWVCITRRSERMAGQRWSPAHRHSVGLGRENDGKGRLWE